MTPSLHTLYGETMGTRWRVCVVGAHDASLHALHDGIQRTLDAVVAQMSTWEPGSDLCRYNRAAAGARVALPEACFDVLRCALEIARESDGAFDPTVGALVDAWGFGAGGRPRGIPTDDAIADARARMGWTRIELDLATREALQPGGVQLDFSGIAKGHGVDAVAKHLGDEGIDAALIDVGGELFGYGRKPDGMPWHVLVETAHEEEADERDAGEPCVLALDGVAVATSGDRWHHFDADGRRYAHTLDPRTGATVAQAPAAVTVVAADAMRADAWATALTVLGIEAGFALAERRGMATRFVAHTDGAQARVRATDAFLARVVA